MYKDFSNEKLCEMIVVQEYFGMDKNITKECMKELSLRRVHGSIFQFEDFIDKIRTELPDLSNNFTIPSLRNIIGTLNLGTK